MSDSLVVVAAILLVDHAGSLLLQLRDAHAPVAPNLWGLPGGHVEPGESVADAAVRELWEETHLRADTALALFERHDLPARRRVKYYLYGRTGASQDDIVLGEGAAMVFVPAGQVMDGREFTPETAMVIDRFLNSPEYGMLARSKEEVATHFSQSDTRRAGLSKSERAASEILRANNSTSRCR